MYDVSIIIPIYNTSKYIQQCAISLFEQDYDNIEYIFINDCTQDNSMEILNNIIQQYPNRKNDIKIINHTINQGSGIARKDGILAASGEYTIQIDSDDWVELDMISSFMKAARLADADIVVSDLYINSKNREIYINQDFSSYINPSNKLSYLKSILSHYILPSLCNKLIKKEIYTKINFSEFSFAEDWYLNIQMFYYSNKIAYINKAFLHYRRVNGSSITTKKSQRLIIDHINFNKQSFSFLNEKQVLQEVREDFYIGLFKSIVSISNIKITKEIKNICPECFKPKYVLKNKKFGILKKIIYLTIFIDSGFIYNLSRRLYVA